MPSIFTALSHKPARGLVLLLLGLALAACSGLGGEPRIVATLPPPTAAPVSFPAQMPDLALGARLYAENCTRCHGIGGRGDGVLIGTGPDQINPPPRDFTDPATTRDQTPLDWYNTITNGRLERLMPPWNEALAPEERWAVAMYTWAMQYQPGLIAAGEQLWAGQNANLSLPSQRDLIQLTDAALLATAAQTAELTGFVDGLDENEQRAAAAYLRTRAFDNIAVIGQPLPEIAQAPTPQPGQPVRPAATPETTAAAPVIASAVGTVSGAVTNGTAGASVPPGLLLTLRVFDLTSSLEILEERRETPANPDFTYRFDDVTLQPDRGYVVTALYQNRVFGNNTVPQDLTIPALDLPVTLYEVTNDPSVIQITGLVTQIVAAGDAIQVAQVFSFTNTSDRLFSTDTEFGQTSFGETRYGSVSVAVPPGAALRGFADEQERYIIAEDGSSVTDTAPVLPGEGHILHMLYSLPYTGELTIEQPVNFAVEGPVRLLITPDTVQAESAMMPPIGPQTLRSVTYQGYGGTLSLPAGDVIRYQLRGAAADTTAESGAPGVIPASTFVPLALIAAGLVIIGAGVVVYLRGRPAAVPAVSQTPTPPPDGQTLIDGLVRQIAELDDARAAGEIDEATYQKRRQKLKTRLAELMDSD